MQRERQDFLADLNHAIQINPNDAEAYCQRGLARKNLGDIAGACLDLFKGATLFLSQGDKANYLRYLDLLTQLPP